MKKLLCFPIVAFAVMAAIVSCQKDDNNVDVVAVRLDRETLLITRLNQEVALVATVLPHNSTNMNIDWTSSNDGVASVNEDGVVTAVSYGEATITVTSKNGGKIAECVVTVREPSDEDVPVESISLDRNAMTLKSGEKATIRRTIAPYNAFNKEVVWTSSDEDVATVRDGIVNAVGYGEAVITATTVDGNKKDECAVNVLPNITLGVSSLQVIFGTKVQLKATVIPSSVNQNATWKSSDPSVATVDANGLVTALKLGETTITVTSVIDDVITATCVINVINPIALPVDMDIAQGMTLKFSNVDSSYWVTPDYFEETAPGEYTFRAISGKYRINRDSGLKYVSVEVLNSSAALATTQADGSGAVWIIGNGVGIPSVTAKQVGWTPGNAICMAPISDKVYSFTAVAGEQISTESIDIKFFHQKNWGGEFNNPGAITNNASDIIWYGNGSNGADPGNMRLQEPLTPGLTYEFIFDLSAGRGAPVLNINVR